MQSILQYRRFGRHIKAQYEQDRDRVHELATGEKAIQNPLEPVDSLTPHDDKARHASEVDLASPSTNEVLDKLDSEEIVERKHERKSSADQEKPRCLAEEGHDLGKEDTRRTASRRVSMQRMGTGLGQAMTGVDVRRPTTKEGGGDKHMFVVSFQGEKDSLNPQNWSFKRRWFATINVALIAWVVGVASSIDSAALGQAAKEFGVSKVTESLATGLFLVRFGSGALVAGPCSEEIGRNPVYIATLVLYMIWVMASALAPSIGAQLAFRFLAGIFASTPLTCAGGSVSDLWTPAERVYAFPIFANAAFMGPMTGPVIGGFIAESSLSWRWCEWITLISSGAVLAMIVLCQPETYSPVLLKWKAAHLRQLTKDSRYVSSVEIRGESFGHRLVQALYHPFLLIAREPIILLFGMYLTVIYIILFTFLDGFTFIFTDTYELSQGVTGLCFLGIVVGLCLSTLWVPYIRKRYLRSLRIAEQKAEDEGKPATTKLPPEVRLWFAMLGAPAVPISLFWMGWTARPSISIWSPLAATVLFGYGTLCIFISCYQYLIDSYELYAASALASVTVIRYVASGGMVVVAIPMYEKLGIDWTCTLMGCISATMVPVPYLFYIYGSKIRKWSKFTVD